MVTPRRGANKLAQNSVVTTPSKMHKPVLGVVNLQKIFGIPFKQKSTTHRHHFHAPIITPANGDATHKLSTSLLMLNVTMDHDNRCSTDL